MTHDAHTPRRWRAIDVVFGVIVVACVGTALYHLAAMVWPLNTSSPTRNAVFVGINAACAYFLWRRPRWFVALFAVLVVQQLWSHGEDLVRVWREQGAIDWISVPVVVGMPLILLLLLVDRRSASQR